MFSNKFFVEDFLEDVNTATLLELDNTDDDYTSPK